MSVDVSEVAEATDGLQIDGPSAQPLAEVPAPEPDTEPEPVIEPSSDALDHSVASEQLFDASQFSAVPTMDGQATDTLDVAFGGKVSYEATSVEGRTMFDKLPLGGTFELRVAGRVVKKSGAWKEKADETEVVTGAALLKIDTIYVLSAEEL